jgi:hypothetical protein
MTEPSLRWLQAWAHRQYVLETPNLEHSVSVNDDGGSPQMHGAVLAYLNNAPDKLDKEGRLRTPLRAALARITDDELRLFLRDLIPNALNPSLVARIHNLPRWSEARMMHVALLALWRAYQNVLASEYRRTARPGWLDMSESQQHAEAVA